MPPALITLNLRAPASCTAPTRVTSTATPTSTSSPTSRLSRRSSWLAPATSGTPGPALATQWSVRLLDHLAGTGTPSSLARATARTVAADGVATGGYDMIQIYSDNHGEAMAWVNGDANLDVRRLRPRHSGGAVTASSSSTATTASWTTSSAQQPSPPTPTTRTRSRTRTLTPTPTSPSPGHGAASRKSTVVETLGATGSSTTWSSTSLTATASATSTTSLHPVLGELVNFLIDSPDGRHRSDDVNGNAAEAPVIRDADQQVRNHAHVRLGRPRHHRRRRNHGSADGGRLASARRGSTSARASSPTSTSSSSPSTRRAPSPSTRRTSTRHRRRRPVPTKSRRSPSSQVGQHRLQH